MRVQVPSYSLMSTDNVVPILGGAVNLDQVRSLREPVRGFSFMLRIPEGEAELQHDKRLPPPQTIVTNQGIFLHWLIPADQAEAADPPFIPPKFIEN